MRKARISTTVLLPISSITLLLLIIPAGIPAFIPAVPPVIITAVRPTVTRALSANTPHLQAAITAGILTATVAVIMADIPTATVAVIPPLLPAAITAVRLVDILTATVAVIMGAIPTATVVAIAEDPLTAITAGTEALTGRRFPALWNNSISGTDATYGVTWAGFPFTTISVTGFSGGTKSFSSGTVITRSAAAISGGSITRWVN